jgi:carboxyl-terminal processing protease
MRRRIAWTNILSFALLSGSAAAFAYVAGYAGGVQAERRQDHYQLLGEVRGLLEQYHLGGLPSETALEYGAVRGLLSALNDPYSVFLEPPSQELETQNLQGEFGGIGVSIRRDSAGLVRMSPFPDYPAMHAGIDEGDQLLQIDDHTVQTDTALDTISAWVRGPIGSQVRIGFRHADGAIQTATLTRVKVEIPSVAGRLLDQNPSVGLVAISRFSDKTPAETQILISSLVARGARSVILDLRDNGGGLLDSGIKTADLFLTDGIIMFEDQQGQPEKTYAVTAPGAYSQLPLAVIVNHGTASASEIVAGALRDKGRAPLIGQATYGKGSVQLIFELPDHSSVHITTARWYTPSRTKIDGTGLKPDYPIDPGTNGSDPEVDRALEYLLKINGFH